MAWAEPSTKITAFAKWYTSEVSAYANHHQEPFVLGRSAVRISCLGIVSKILVPRDSILEIAERHSRRCFYLFISAVSHEHRLATPLYGHRHSKLDCRNVDLGGGQRQGGSVGVHLVDKWPRQKACSDGADGYRRHEYEVTPAFVGGLSFAQSTPPGGLPLLSHDTDPLPRSAPDM